MSKDLVSEGVYDGVEYFSSTLNSSIWYHNDRGFLTPSKMKKPEFRKWVRVKIIEGIKQRRQ